jgi:hypothetical protein
MEHCNFKFKSLLYCLDQNYESKDLINDRLLKTADCDYYLNLRKERTDLSKGEPVDYDSLKSKLRHYNNYTRNR